MRDRILGAQFSISDEHLLRMPVNYIESYVYQEISRLFANKIVEDKIFDLKENVDYSTMSKQFRAEVVVLTKDEYKQLEEKAQLANDMKRILAN